MQMLSNKIVSKCEQFAKEICIKKQPLLVIFARSESNLGRIPTGHVVYAVASVASFIRYTRECSTFILL